MQAMLGPFHDPPFCPWFQVSSLMTRSKKNLDARRVIIDMSFHPGRGVNAGIARNFYLGMAFNFTLPSVYYPNRSPHVSGPYWVTLVSYLSRAYRQLQVCPC